MAKTQAQIQERSDAKRGVRAKSYKLPETTIALIAELAEQTGLPQSPVITAAVKMLKQQHEAV